MNYLSLSKWSIDGVRRNAIPHHVIFAKHAAKSVISTGVQDLSLKLYCVYRLEQSLPTFIEVKHKSDI